MKNSEAIIEAIERAKCSCKDELLRKDLNLFISFVQQGETVWNYTVYCKNEIRINEINSIMDELANSINKLEGVVAIKNIKCICDRNIYHYIFKWNQ